MKLKIRSKIAFAIGAFGKDIVYMLVASYLLYYYNVVLGMDSVFIGVVMMGARIFDALNDPLMGIIVSKTRTKFGKFRPWIIAGTVMNAVITFALFATPNGDDSMMRVWLLVFYLAWGVSYTLMDIPFWSMIPAITNPGKDREQLSSIARAASGVGDALPTILTMMIVPILSASAIIADYKIGFKWWALIIAVIFVLSEIICVLFVPEKKIDEEDKAPTIKQMFGSLFKNDQALTVVLSVILVYTALNITSNLILYFFQFDVGNTDYYSVFVGAVFVVQVLVMLLLPLFRKKFSKYALFYAGFVFQIVGFAVLLIMAGTGMYRSITWALLIIPGALVYAGYGLLNVLLTIFLSDSVDYGEYKNGVREEAVIFSMQTFTVKLASGIAVAIAGVVINLIHLDTEAVTQTAETLSGLRFAVTIPPAIILVIGILVFRRCYKLTERRMNAVGDALEKRRAGKLYGVSEKATRATLDDLVEVYEKEHGIYNPKKSRDQKFIKR